MIWINVFISQTSTINDKGIDSEVLNPQAPATDTGALPCKYRPLAVFLCL